MDGDYIGPIRINRGSKRKNGGGGGEAIINTSNNLTLEKDASFALTEGKSELSEAADDTDSWVGEVVTSPFDFFLFLMFNLRKELLILC